MPGLLGVGSWCGAYLVYGRDAAGPWWYVGKGDPDRALASLRARGGQGVTMLSSGLSGTESFAIEAAVILALRAVGARLLNRAAGHHAASLTPSAILGASLNPAGGVPRRRLTLAEVGPAIQVPVNLLHGHVAGDIRPSVYQVWSVSDEKVAKLRWLLARGRRVRLLAVAPGGRGIVADVFRITAVKTFPSAGSKSVKWRYFGLAPDPGAALLRGHFAPESRQQRVRYLAGAAAGADAFQALT